MRQSRKPRIILIILIALCGLFVYSYTSRLGEKARLDGQIAAMQTRIDQAKIEQLELQEEYSQLNQPDFLDRAARELFDMALPGDKLLVILDEDESSTNTTETALGTATNPIDYRSFPIWQQWVVFFTTDSFTLSIQ